MLLELVRRSLSMIQAGEGEVRKALAEISAVAMEHRDIWNRFADAPGLSIEDEVSGIGFSAEGGMFVPVTSATTIDLAAPTSFMAGQPLVIYNSSGGIVLLDPGDSTINGQNLGWIDDGMHILVPDESGWFGGFSEQVEIGITGTLTGVTTGATSFAVTDAEPLDKNRLLLALVGIQAASFVQVPTISGLVALGPNNVINATTVAARIALATANMMPQWTTGAMSIAHPDEANDLLGIAVMLYGATQTSRFRRITGTGATTSSSVEITTTYPGAMVIDLLINDDAADTGTAGSGQTEIANGSAGGATIAMQASWKSMPTPGTTTMDWTDLSAVNHAHIAIAIEPARAA